MDLIENHINFVNRNRLESNAEHWSALLLSLRELTEWVIRKETELNALAPPRGDLNALIKQQVNYVSYYYGGKQAYVTDYLMGCTYHLS